MIELTAAAELAESEETLLFEQSESAKSDGACWLSPRGGGAGSVSEGDCTSADALLPGDSTGMLGFRVEQSAALHLDAVQPNQVVARLARRIKHLQSTDPGAGILWAQHCVAFCDGTKDPSRHERWSLSMFLTWQSAKRRFQEGDLTYIDSILAIIELQEELLRGSCFTDIPPSSAAAVAAYAQRASQIVAAATTDRINGLFDAPREPRASLRFDRCAAGPSDD